MNNTLQTDTLAAIETLNNIPSKTDSRYYALLEEFYTRPYDFRHSPLLAREYYDDSLWTEIKQHDDLLVLFRWFACPLTGRSHELCPANEIPALRLLLADMLSSLSELNYPEVCKRAKSLTAYLDREGLVNAL
jgi:hypothetical protein